MKTLLIIANNNFGDSLSGGDRIYLNIAKYWQDKFDVTFLASQEAKKLNKQYLTQNYPTIQTDFANLNTKPTTSNILRHQLRRSIKALKLIKTLPVFNYVYSASDFYPDLLPALFLKLKNPKKTKWIAGFYLLAPNPISPQSPYNQTGNFFKGLIYFLGQIPAKIIVRIFADHVFVTSKPDQLVFKHNVSHVIQGGVDPIKHIKNIPLLKRKYDAVYLGRLHHQKGVLILIDIWKHVVKCKPNAKLAIIGDGELEHKINQKIKKLKLTKNIDMLGFMTGSKKNNIFRNSKIVLHPATYDSGGMAAAEAMAWGLPAVSFDLEALKTYYPYGMIKTTCFDQQKFAQNIISLLNNQKLYKQYSKRALKLIKNKWNWKNRLNTIAKKI